MKNIFLGLIVAFAFLPRVSFGANLVPVVTNPQLTVCNKQLDAESIAFFTQQGINRKAWMTANSAIVAAQDQKVKTWAAQIEQEREQAKSSGNTSWRPPSNLPPITDSSMVAFVQSQEGAKEVFLAKLAQDRQKCMSSQSSESSSTN